ncbi:amino acid permease [Caballeronia sp. LZ029]|nr:amino acid permease [Caballeronia sp. LZ029]MDR5748983.1 amino acid permease [Caballeronia sp. LZ029]
MRPKRIVTYANNYLPYFIRPGSEGVLITVGFVTCAAQLGLTELLNLMVVRRLLNVNTAITWSKILVPVLTITGLMAASTPWSVMGAAPGSYKFSGLFTALPAVGIVFSYLGFRTAIDLGGETANPHRNIPLAVIGSVLLAAALYILLQVAFIWALTPAELAHGWAKISFKGAMGPFAGLATTLGLTGQAHIRLYHDETVELTGILDVLIFSDEMDMQPLSIGL